MSFTHLHVHSYYSLMDGLNSPAELVKAAKDAGQTALAITDHGTLSSHREMQIACKDQGIKPILGVEAYISPTDRFDRGSADSYYRRAENPHYYPEGSYVGKRVESKDMSMYELRAYFAGYEYNEKFGDKKDWS